MNLVVSSGATDLGAAGDVEEGSSEENFEGGVVDDLDLEVDGDRSKLDGLVLDESQSHRPRRICRLHTHRLAGGNRRSELLPNISPHDNYLSSAIEDALWLDSVGESWEDDSERE